MPWQDYTQIQLGVTSGFPFYFPSLFGGGGDGDLTATDQSDVGHLIFGAKQYNNLTIPAGVTWTIARGTGSGALVIAAKTKITIEGTITASGEAGANGVNDGGGKGGDAAGGGTGGAKNTGGGASTLGTYNRATYGRGLGNDGLAGSSGAGSGAFRNNTASGANASMQGVVPSTTALNVGTFFNASRLQLDPKLVPWLDIAVSMNNGTAATNGTDTGRALPSIEAGPWNTDKYYQKFHPYYLTHQLASMGGAVTGVLSQQAAGGGGGGNGGFVILEAETIELVSGYAINCNGGNGGNGYSSNGTTAVAMGGMPGQGGVVVLICRNLIGSTAAINVSAGTPGTGAGTSVATPLNGLAGELRIIKV